MVRFARWCERIFGRTADARLCVSRGFAKFIEHRFRLSPVAVLYDRPAAAFCAIERSAREQSRQALLSRLAIRCAGPVGFIVCPTSWTADESFDALIGPVRDLEDRMRGSD